MDRMDKDLAFLLRYENVAWYEKGAVRILDRRVYPYKESFVTCKTHGEVAQALTDMVTQSGGPFMAVGMGMALAAHEAAGQKSLPFMTYLKTAADTLSNARPTTAKRMMEIALRCLTVAEEALRRGTAPDEAIFLHTIDEANIRYKRKADAAVHLVRSFPEKGTVMTQCFAETIVGMMLLECRKQKKDISFICPETRPYFQGARLTASVIRDMDFPVHIITDNMPGYIMKEKNVDVFTSASDVITVSGHVVNKVGTFQIALLSNHFGIPYFVVGRPSAVHPDPSSIHIEERDPSLVTDVFGVTTVKEGVGAYYPAFDITPPSLVSGVVTDLGIYSPFDLSRYLEDDAAK